jgi:hypothetical protein
MSSRGSPNWIRRPHKGGIVFRKLIAELKAAGRGPELIRNLASQLSDVQGNLAMAQFQLADFSQRSLLLQGRMAARALPRRQRVRDLSKVEFRVFSQWGEDGIIEWLAEHVAVPNERFIEFGVETFREANCRFLMQNRNWKGLVFDGNAAYMAALAAESLFWMHDLTAKATFITAENIDELIREAGFDGPLGILSIDVDGNDYWIWEAIASVDPAIVVCEYNPILGDTRAIAVPYDPAFRRFDAHYSGLYFGTSIAALKLLASRKGYAFVGTNQNGINAFFVKNNLATPVLDLIEVPKAFPSRHRDSRNPAGQLTFAGGRERLALIRDMPVVDVETGRSLLLSDIEQPYSEAWLQGMA